MYRLSLLLIGAGDICNKHLEYLSKISKINLFGIYSRTQSKAQLLANKYKIKKVFSSFDQIKENLMNIDAIFILVNADQTIKVFNKVKIYNKILFFEKPIGMNINENKKILRDVKKYKIKTFVGFNRRYYSIFTKALSILTNNNSKIINILIEGHERLWLVKKIYKDNKYIKNWPYLNSIHHVDLIRYFGGDIKLKSFYKIKNKNSHIAIMRSNKDISISYISNYDYFDSWKIKIYNDNGDIAEFNPLEKCFLRSHNKYYEIKSDKVDLLYKNGFRNMHLNFIHYCQKNKKKWQDQDVLDAYQSTCLVKKIFY